MRFRSSANFVGIVISFLQRIFICVTFRLYACGASSSPPRYPLKSKWFISNQLWLFYHTKTKNIYFNQSKSIQKYNYYENLSFITNIVGYGMLIAVI